MLGSRAPASAGLRILPFTGRQGRFPCMSLVPASGRTAMFADQWLIAKVVTSLMLAFLLMLGAAGAGHDTSAAAGGAVSASALASDDATDGEQITVTAAIASSAGEITTLICALGLFCGLLGLLVMRGLRVTRPRAAVAVTALRRLAPSTPTGRSLPPAPSLAALCISRT